MVGDAVSEPDASSEVVDDDDDLEFNNVEIIKDFRTIETSLHFHGCRQDDSSVNGEYTIIISSDFDIRNDTGDDSFLAISFKKWNGIAEKTGSKIVEMFSISMNVEYAKKFVSHLKTHLDNSKP